MVFGGGIYTDGPYLEVNNSTIADNQAPWGGGIFGSLSGEEWMYIRQSTISNNVADDPNTSNGQGGGIRCQPSSASTVANLTMRFDHLQ